jgi:bud site selection protein 20
LPTAKGARIREGGASILFLGGRSGILTLKRLKALKDEPYSQKEAEAAIGLRTDNGPRHNAKDNVDDVEVEMVDSELVEDGLAT